MYFQKSVDRRVWWKKNWIEKRAKRRRYPRQALRYRFLMIFNLRDSHTTRVDAYQCEYVSVWNLRRHQCKIRHALSKAVLLIFLFYLIQYEAINQAACDLAKEVANEGDALVAGNISQVPAYLAGLGKEVVQKEFKKQTDIFVRNNVDFLIGEVSTLQKFYCYSWIRWSEQLFLRGKGR